MRIFSSLAAALLMFTFVGNAAEPPLVLPLWPGEAPGEKGDIGEEADTTKPTDNLIAGRPLIRLGNVSKPTITVYRASEEKNTGAAVIVAPGGGYHILALDLEGTEVCEWLNSIGVTAILLKYRVPVRKDRPRWEAPLQDAQRAIGLVRQHAAQWKIDPARVGILGFSAGGHLSAAASTRFKERSYPPVDAADELNARPDFTVLIYPGGLVPKDKQHELSPELTVSAETPPAFIAMTMDDGVRVENAFTYALALKNAKVACELHVYPEGGHGYGLRASEKLVTTWPKRAEEWMQTAGFLAK